MATIDYDANDAWVFHLREGEIAEAWWRPEDLYAADEFWIRPQAGRPDRKPLSVLLRRLRTSARSVPGIAVADCGCDGAHRHRCVTEQECGLVEAHLMNEVQAATCRQPRRSYAAASVR